MERPESDLLLLALQLDRSTLAETLPAYWNQGVVLVPLGELCRLLGLAISVDVAGGLASGFILVESRLFALDTLAQRVVVEGVAGTYDSARIEIHEDDIYVDAALIAQWLPLGLDVDIYGALITVRPREPLPMQLRLDRERQLELSGASRRESTGTYPRVALPYRFLDGPFVDQILRYSWEPDRAGAGASGGEGRLDYSTYATGDLLFMEGSAFLSGTDEGVLNSRLTLSRRDPEGGLLGSLGAREIALGDVFHPGLDLIAAPRAGPGLLISNFPLEHSTQFDRQSFRGDLPPGWEAELYRGTELLSYVQSRPDGLYEFLDVPLLFGLNVFRVELYGPQGQRRSESYRYNVGDALTPPGRVYYRLVGSQPGRHLLGGLSLEERPRASFELSAGLTKNLSGSLSLASVDVAEGRHTYAKASLLAFRGFVFANLDVAADREGGSAWQATAQSRLNAFGFQVQHAELDGFVSERFVSPLSPLKRRTRIRLDTAIPESWLPRIPVLLEIRQDRLASGERVSELSGRLSAFRRGVFVTNQLTWNSVSGGGGVGGGSPARSSAFGQLLVSRYLKGFSLRGEIDYGIEPDPKLRSAALTAERQLSRGLQVSGGISRAFGTDETKLLAGASKLEGVFGITVLSEYSDLRGLGASLLLSVSVGRDARNGKWRAQARPLAGAGAVSARAFVDTNGNERWDAGETAIAGAGFLLNGSGSLARTNDAGEAFLAQLSPDRDIDLAVAAATLEDPYWKPALEGVRILPRPGKVAVIDFPVLITGEITGTVYRTRGGSSRPASGIELELVDPAGRVVKKITTAYDGFYDLIDVRPGIYALRVNAEQAARLQLTAPARALTVQSNGTVSDGIDFLLEPSGTTSISR